jgi:arabinogalactan endo-1,4-beta-galactosidase
MKHLIYNLSLIAIISVGIANCSSGSTSSTSDIQKFNITTNNYQINGTATNCRTISANGSCNISVTYSITSSYYTVPQTISLTGLTGYSSTINSCPQAYTTSVSCNFTVNNTSGSTSQVQNANFAFNSTPLPILSAFLVGGGFTLPNNH